MKKKINTRFCDGGSRDTEYKHKLKYNNIAFIDLIVTVGFPILRKILVLKANFNNISVISWRSVLLTEETTDLPQVTDKPPILSMALNFLN